MEDLPSPIAFPILRVIFCSIFTASETVLPTYVKFVHTESGWFLILIALGTSSVTFKWLIKTLRLFDVGLQTEL